MQVCPYWAKWITVGDKVMALCSIEECEKIDQEYPDWRVYSEATVSPTCLVGFNEPINSKVWAFIFGYTRREHRDNVVSLYDYIIRRNGRWVHSLEDWDTLVPLFYEWAQQEQRKEE